MAGGGGVDLFDSPVFRDYASGINFIQVKPMRICLLLNVLDEEPLHDVVGEEDAESGRHQGDQGAVDDAIHVA